jgi:ribonuclease HI
LAILRDPRTQKVVVSPPALDKVAVAHTRNLLCTSPPQPPEGKDWQQEALWTPLKQRWTPVARAAATALATKTDIQRIITHAKTNGAPGLDGIQYGVLKLLLRTGGGELLTMLTNITNTVLRSTSLPEALGKSEIVYFYKKGDPADMGNYRGISLQSVMYKLAAAFTATQLQSAAEALDLLSAAQVAARKGGRAADHVATMAAVIAHAHRTGQELHLLTCDIAKAFDEAPRAALLEALERHGYPPELIRRVQLLQTCTGARVRTRYGISTAQVTTTRGCKQGCPLSPITYCLFTNMLLRGLQSSRIPGYSITPTQPGAAKPSAAAASAAEAEPSPAATLAIATPPTLDHQGYLDDLALFASSAAASTSQLAYANDFMQAYGMRFNTSKCRHSVASPTTGDGARVTLNTGWSSATPAGTAVGPEIPQTQKGGTFEYLGHHLTTDGDWTAQGLAMTAKLTRAMHTVSIASEKGACGLLWTARLAEHDAVATMPYYMTTTAMSTSTLDKALTALVRPVWRKGSVEGHHVACMAAIGSPAALKGLGLTHPEALDLAEKACALLRLLNTASPEGIGALAADGLKALRRGSAPSQAYPKTAKHTSIPATHTGGVAALRKAPAGEASWTIVENYKDFAATQMGDLCPALKHALEPAAAATKSVRAFLALTAGDALTIAAPRLMQTVPSCWREHAPVTISEAEEIVFAGKLTRRSTPPDALLTPRAQETLTGLLAPTRAALLQLLAADLIALLTGPLAFSFVTRPDLRHLLHAARHGPHTGNAVLPALASVQVGVDGSFKEHHDGRKLAAGAVCYYTRGAHPGHTEARMITCTFDGEQTSANAEMSSMSLALQSLSRADALHVSWDLKPGVDTMHASLAQTRPGAEAQAEPPAAGAQGADPREAAAAAHYAHNPHMHRAVALASRDLAAGRQRQVFHQAAHSREGQDARVDAILTSTPGAHVYVQHQRREYVVPSAALAALDSFFASGQGAPQAGTASHTRLVQNALSDWAAKRVTVHGQPASTHLSPNTLSHARWMVVDERGAIQQSDNWSLRRSVISRTSRALVEARAVRSPYLQTKLNLQALWAAESTHALTLRTAGRRGAVAPANEYRTRFCVQMLYESCFYAKDATEHTPALAEVEIGGNTLDLTCPLCGAADSDSKHHLFHECAETRAAQAAMQRAIAEAISAASAGAISAQAASDIASAATSRPDFFAGQIPKRALDLLLAAKRASAGATGAGEQCAIPQPGTIQQLILKHCKAVHETRKRVVDTDIKAADTGEPKLTSCRDVRAYRHALWGTATHAARVEASQQQQQRGPSQPPRQADARPPAQAHQQPSGLTANLNAQYAPLQLRDADVPGDGNCLLYAALGLSVGACAGTDARSLADRINGLRAHVIQHARGLSAQLKRKLMIWRTGAALSDSTGAPAARGQHALWSLDYQAVAGHFMTDNVMHSLAATLDSDIVVIKTDATGLICAKLDHFHARAWTVAGSREPDGGPTMDAYSSVLWAGGLLEATPTASQQGRQTRASGARRPTQLTLRQLLAQRQAEQRSVTLIYSNGGTYTTGHFRAVAQQPVVAHPST